MPRFMQPCSKCGALSRGASLCETHRIEQSKARDRRRARTVDTERKSKLYNYAYRKEAKAIKETATHCHICREPFLEGDKIEADHLIAGMIGSPLAAAHRLCNQQRGNRPLR
jgi:hypothetical protein